MGNTSSSLPAGVKPTPEEDKPQLLLVDQIRLHNDLIIQRSVRAREISAAERGFDFEAEENEALSRLRTPAFHEFHPSAWTLNLATLDVHIQSLEEQEEEQLRSINSYLLWGPRGVDEKELIDRHIRSLERDLENVWDQLVICRAMRRLHAENTHRTGRWKSLGCACCEQWLGGAWSAGDGGTKS